AWIAEKVSASALIYDKALNNTRPLQFGDFAVLVSRNSDFADIENALGDIDIPYVTFAGKGFLKRQEILDFENMLRWLAHPDDSFALLSVLRSPFFALNDGILHRIGAGDFVGASLWKK